jgi:aldose 1-epimerase
MEMEAKVTREPFEDVESYVLREPASGSEARVVPGLGNAVVSFRTRVGGVTFDVVQSPPSLAELREHPTWYAIPVLFPYPGRVRDARFTFEGREIRLPATDGHGNAIHGAVKDRPWTVLSATADCTEGAVLRSQIDTASSPDVLTEWPFPFRLTMEARLSGGALTLSFIAENAGEANAPLGLGLHPYFATPLLGVGTRDDALVSVAAERLWEQPRALPTGVTYHVAETVDLRTAKPLSSLPSTQYPGLGKMSNLLYSRFEATRGLAPDAPGGVEARIRNAAQRIEVRMETSAGFGALVLFTPPWNSSLSLEPHTCVPDALNLAAKGIEAGVVVLPPGQTWRGWVRFSAREL